MILILTLLHEVRATLASVASECYHEINIATFSVKTSIEELQAVGKKKQSDIPFVHFTHFTALL